MQTPLKHSAHALVSEYLKKFKLCPIMDLEDFKHWLMPRQGVIDSFVLSDDSGKVTDFCSLCSKVVARALQSMHKKCDNAVVASVAFGFWADQNKPTVKAVRAQSVTLLHSSKHVALAFSACAYVHMLMRSDVMCFYHLPSTVIGNDKHDTLFAAYSFYNVATTMTLCALMRDALVMARDRGMDVFNALNLMDNEQFLQELMFGIGDGHLQYYLYNWRCPDMKPNETGLVLL
eukprot:15896-Heterococcus_DN1.PRE.2